MQKRGSLYRAVKKEVLDQLALNYYNRTETAYILGITIRTLRNKMNQYRQDGDYIPQCMARRQDGEWVPTRLGSMKL